MCRTIALPRAFARMRKGLCIRPDPGDDQALQRLRQTLLFMTPAHTASSLNDWTAAFTLWAHTMVPAGSDSFDGVAIFSLVCYLIFAVVALQYALRTWAEKVMLATLVSGAAASFLLHLSLLHSPTYQGEGPLWKFVSLSQYLPWAVLMLAAVYLLYRTFTALKKRGS